MSRRITLADVARAASVSKTTASMALNGKGMGKIPASTRQRVQSAADALQFRPHGVARALARRRADAIGVVCTLNPFVELAHHAFEQALLSALFYHALECGYNPMIYGAPPVEAGEDLLARYADGRCDGFVLLYPEPDSTLLRRLTQAGIPVVAICRPVEEASWVDSDHAGGIRLALNHLIESGHRRIGYLIDPGVDRDSHVRVLAFRRAFQDCKLPLREDWIVAAETGEAFFEEKLTRLFASLEAPTALVTWNDSTAFEVYRVLRKLGLRIPEDVSIIGFDDIAAARTLVPALTTVRQDVVRMARMAVDIVVSALSENATLTQTSVVCPVELIVRQSTAPPAVSPC